ncbi:Caleosin-domain-containing protein [Agrocybe pediades]|nr:Caleosin-domain-containing protein [Agrocybe pediades]
MVAPKDPLSAAPGTGFERGKQNTALQGHVAFFDRDEDGIIWPMDTYVGFREIKFGVFLSIVSVLVIHLGFSYFTWGSWLPDPFFRLRVNLMHKGSIFYKISGRKFKQ